MLAIIRGIRKHSLEVYKLTGLYNGGGELRPIVTGPAAHNAGGEKMCVTVADASYSRPFVSEKAFVPFSVNVISGCMTILKTSGIHGRPRMVLEDG